MLRTVKIVLAATVLASCATMDNEQATTAAPDAKAPQQAAGPAAKAFVDASAELSTSASALADANAGDEPRAAATIYRGNDSQWRMPAASGPVKFIGDDISLNFEQAPLSEVMHAILGDILQLDYIVDRPVQGEVTLRTRTPIPRGELLEVLESLLKANNALLIKGSDGRYLVTGSQGSRLSPEISNPNSSGAGFSTIIVPLRYISASNMAEILEPVAEERSFVLVDNSRNILMLAGTRDQLDGWLDIVTTFDVDQLQGMSVGMFPLENSNVEDVAEALAAMLDNGGQEDLVRVVPVKRLNSLLIMTPRSHYLDTLGVWIERLDSAPNSKFEKRIFVYPVQNTSARRLSKLLNGLYADELGVVTTMESDSNVGGGVAPGMSLQSMGSGLNGSPTGSNVDDRDMGSAITSIGALADSRGPSAMEDVRVVADDDNNALMIYSTGKQFDVIKTALEQLDTVATQVIIEASILEVTLTDKLEYGLEWTFNNSVGSNTGTGLLSTPPGGALSAASAGGFSYIIANTAGQLPIKAVLNALAEEALLNVISTPSVMVLDNNTAFIHVGDQVPIISEQSTGLNVNDRITQSVTYKDTGVQLEVTPSVNAGGLVTMDVKQSVTDVRKTSTGDEENPTFLERTIMSRVSVRSGQSVVLGGLIRENASDAGSGIPFLHDLPLVGPLFGATRKENNRTELLVIITPRALVSENDLHEVGEEMRAQIRNMELIDMQ
ncbi:MAG: type II secretion system secretin GspD [Halioglobus sp.]|nr:type II secretion system secretin GspD [Halioglobus sp.]